MGPNNKNIAPIRDNSFGEGNHQPTIVMADEQDEEMMEIDENPDGYERLSTENHFNEFQSADDSDSGESEEDEENEVNPCEFEAFQDEVQPPPNVPPIVSADAQLEAEVWNSSTANSDSIELNKEKTQQILTAMSKFTLPNVPAWANEVDPNELLQRIKKNHQQPSK